MRINIPSQPETSQTSEFGINSQLFARLSTRSFLQKNVPNDVLMAVFQAATWAPCGNDEQSWRYIIARTPQDRERFHKFIHPLNLAWCVEAPVLVLAISQNYAPKGQSDAADAFDSGLCWGYLALEALNHGLITYAMTGFDKNKARALLNIPRQFDIHAVIATGYRGDKMYLPELTEEREKMSSSGAQSLFEGIFGAQLN